MKRNKTTLINLKSFKVLIFILSLIACNNGDDSGSNDDNPDLTEDIIQQTFFNSSSLISFTKVDCTLENGTSSECYRIVFSSNPIANGPYCPETINDIGGLGIYDGNTNPGFQVMKASLFNAMEADGFNIVDDNGDIYIYDFTSPPNPGNFSFCLEPAVDDNLQLTFLIPAEPVLASSNNIIDIMELIGVSLDGIPYNGDLPSVANGPVLGENNIPALDPCGGLYVEAGYYQLHFISETMNQVLGFNNITDVSCTLVNQVSGSKLVGFAKDGFPIYAYEIEPSGLDECGGRTSATTEYPEGVYHYVASNTEAPNVPKCLKGVAAINNFSVQ